MVVIRRYECPLHGKVNHVVGMGSDRKPLHWECGETCEVVEYVRADQLRKIIEERDRYRKALALIGGSRNVEKMPEV